MSQEQEGRAIVIEAARRNFGPDVSEYIRASMDSDDNSPFIVMVRDAGIARECLELGDIDGAKDIMQRYRAMATDAGLGLMFDAMMESLGLSELSEP